MNLVLTDSGSVESITSVIQNALDAAIPFGSVKVSTMSVQSPFHVDQTVLLANVLQPHTIVFDLAEAFSPEAALFNALPWHWSRHALATLCVPGIRVLNIPLSSLYLFPNVVHFSTGTRTHGRVKDASTFRPQPKFDTGVDVLQKLETLYMGALDLLAPDSLMNLEAAIGEGRFPRLRKVYVTYYTGDLGEDDADEPPVPSLLCDLAHLHSAFPTVSVTVMIRTRSDMQRFHELYINKAHAGSLQGVDVVLGREMQVVVESSVPGGTVRIWRRT
ncbi:hypothetical protein M427DRAFT_58869 [Gonapodya prolifera JEL478]|uniref:Uncharacterized protein n=1 Tax=Gonapodya prolifera (strain JEL478) TaxID=1344416 RepID=A0A139A8Z1_GONPJ|nr:hypothetical protein M427DRAFT_58869 [Gonapodya prolifera JEL478]|eukprot:KXS13148.1 hypothetical protein M427DRAFT_58869 [Gonapodya prolifera JEL478]